MFHTGTTRLIERWSGLNAARPPLRADFDPTRVADLLPLMFLLAREDDRLAFRIAGEGLRDLFGRPLKGTDVFSLFTAPAAALARRAALDSIRDGAPMVLIAQGRSDMGGQLPLEIVFAPLIGDHGVDRLVGLIQPTATLAHLEGRPVAEVSVRMAAAATTRAPRPVLRLATVDGQRIA